MNCRKATKPFDRSTSSSGRGGSKGKTKEYCLKALELNPENKYAARQLRGLAGKAE
jgi:hypothetical protein